MIPILGVWLAACAPQECPGAWARQDVDGDGYGVGAPIVVCELGPGLAAPDRVVDCDDARPDVHPEATERCDGVDQDCDVWVDEDLAQHTWWADGDGDGFGATFPRHVGCAPPDGSWASHDGDCDDADPTVSPAGVERCGAGDEDCDGLADDADDDVDPASFSTFYRDLDQDGFGDPRVTSDACQLPYGFSRADTDCDDRDPERRPTASEVCDGGEDEDCDDLADDEDPSLDLLTATAWYLDADRDGRGADAGSTLACVAPADRVEVGGDCDDADPAVHELQLWRPDDDGDGFGAEPAVGPSCHGPTAAHVPAGGDPDCDDRAPAVHPEAAEVCGDGVDADCTGFDCRVCDEIVIGLLPSWGEAADPALLFGPLERSWSTLGDCPLRVVDVPWPFTVERLVEEGVTVLWATGPAAVGVRYPPDEVSEVRAFVDGGHGGFVATFLLEYLRTDDSALFDLVGVDPAAIGNTQDPCDPRVEVWDPSHPVTAGLPDTFDLATYPFAQGVLGTWEAALLPRAEIVAGSRDGRDVLIAYEDGLRRGVYASTMVEYQAATSPPAQVVYNAARWASGF